MKRGHRNNAGNKAGRNRGRRAKASTGVLESLPELSTLLNVPTYEELSPSERQREEFEHERERLVGAGEGAPEEFALGCVVRLDRGFPAVVSPSGVARAEFSAALTKGDANNKVAVGDWVCVRQPSGHDMQLIEAIMPRESDIARWRGKARGEKQTLAANVGLVLVAQALGSEPIDCERIVRSAVIARDCGARVAVVFTKADRPGLEVLEQDVKLLRAVLGREAPLVITSSKAERAASEGKGDGGLQAFCREHGLSWGTAGVRSLVGPGVVAIVLGESGAGKSTLLNALLRSDVLKTGSVRASDDAGRHTTVSRRMVSLPGAGIIVDEPGLRSLPLVGHERGLALVFPDVAEAAQACRFRDCTHTHEPGCAVRAAVETGDVPACRADAYVALASEMRASAASLDPDVVL